MNPYSLICTHRLIFYQYMISFYWNGLALRTLWQCLKC